jgi:amidohydrolase
MQTRILVFFISIFLTHLNAIAQAPPNLVQQTASELNDELFELYKTLHRNPELSFEERNTSKMLSDILIEEGFEVTKNFGGYGVVAIMKNGDGPTIMLRADMDALPVKEETGLPYASEVTTTLNGNPVHVMHACGHDIHMSVLIGAAKALVKLKNKWKGALMLILQPAEERSGGAKAMLAEGLYQKFGAPDYALALHANASMAAGTVGICPEYALANVDMVDITVYGKGGHGAYPHTTIDPVVLASRIVLDLQTVVSREVSPLEPAVVTVGSIHGGAKGNIIPDEVKLELTLRSYSDVVRQHTITAIKRITSSLAQSAGLESDLYPKVEVRDESTPALYNDPKLSKQILEAFQRYIGEQNAMIVNPVMGGEDFGKFGRTEENVPICLYWLGTVSEEKIEEAQKGNINLPSLHSPFFAPEAGPSINTGVITMTSAVIELMSNGLD